MDGRAGAEGLTWPGGPACAIGIDVGGTKIAGGLVTGEGTVAARRQQPTDPARGGGPVLEDVAAMARDLSREASRMGLAPMALGVGVPELVDPAGRVFSGYRIAWDGLDVRARLSALMPAVVESDVRAAGLAEARFGAGRAFREFLFVTVGTGVSAVHVRDGQPYRGSRGAALVIANGRRRRRCESCGHLDDTELEDIASGPALVAAMGWPPGRGAAAVLEAARAGDARATSALGRATSELGEALALLVGALDPEAVVVGGGLGSAPGPYWEGLRAAIRAGLWDGDARELPVLQAALGPEAGVVGAAAAAMAARSRQPEPENRPQTVG